MLTPYVTPAAACRAELTIQRSLFIADLVPAASMEEAQEAWAARRKEFHDATHHCFAARIGAAMPQEKSSDDGEPQGTAGHPMLHVLSAAGITNAALIVTRYFGGIKLGAGGLTRAYSGAAADALSAASLLAMTPHLAVSLTISYDTIGLFEKYAEGTRLRITGREFTNKVALSLLTPPAEWAQYQKDLTDLTAGRLIIEEGEEIYVPLPLTERK